MKFKWTIAFFTTRIILNIIGGAALISFACTLKPFYFVTFFILVASLWSFLYFVFQGFAMRGDKSNEKNS